MEQQTGIEPIKAEINNESRLPDLGKIISVLSVFVIILSIIKELLFYGYFGVSITYFFSVSDLALAISQELLEALVFFIILFLLIFIADEVKILRKIFKYKFGDIPKSMKVEDIVKKRRFEFTARVCAIVLVLS